MKTNKIISLFIAILCLGGLFGGCENLEDTYQEFIGKGETIYIGKADSLQTRGGRGRIEVSWLLLSDPKVSRYKVYWDNKSDSIEGNLIKTSNVDTVRILFENMEENMHQFDIFLFDKDGNSSIRSSTIGRVYGDSYEHSLLNRTYLKAIRNDKRIIMEWMPSEPQVVRVEMEYQNSLNEIVRKNLPGISTLDTLSNFPAGGSLSYRTVFIPEPLALDTFYTDFISVTLN